MAFQYIQKEIVASAYTGFYHVPPIWCCEAPSPDEWANGPPNSLLKVVLHGELDCGIRFKVRRDGLFLLDCNNWPEAPFTRIPGYDTKMTPEAIQAESSAETRSNRRATLVNAFQLFLYSEQRFLGRRPIPMGLPVEAGNLLAQRDFGNPGLTLYSGTSDPYRTFVQNALGELGPPRVSDMPKREVVAENVLRQAFVTLERAIELREKDALKLTELLFLADARWRHNAKSEAVILSWVCCEKMLSDMWVDYVSPDGPRRGGVNSKRLQKLKGRDFTASVVLEVLELASVLPLELYKRLDAARRLRNKWLHSTEKIATFEASKALISAQDLFEVHTGIKVKLSLGGYKPGTGGWYTHLYKYPKKT